eukprot:scaffold59361_cov98-Phaeocystis_antarctica.AAC.3
MAPLPHGKQIQTPINSAFGATTGRAARQRACQLASHAQRRLCDHARRVQRLTAAPSGPGRAPGAFEWAHVQLEPGSSSSTADLCLILLRADYNHRLINIV